MMNMNPMQLMGLLKGHNPQEMVMSMLQNSNIDNDTMQVVNKLVSLAQKGDTSQVNKIAEDFFAQRGMNFNQEFNSFMSAMK